MSVFQYPYLYLLKLFDIKDSPCWIFTLQVCSSRASPAKLNVFSLASSERSGFITLVQYKPLCCATNLAAFEHTMCSDALQLVVDASIMDV